MVSWTWAVARSMAATVSSEMLDELESPLTAVAVAVVATDILDDEERERENTKIKRPENARETWTSSRESKTCGHLRKSKGFSNSANPISNFKALLLLTMVRTVDALNRVDERQHEVPGYPARLQKNKVHDPFLRRLTEKTLFGSMDRFVYTGRGGCPVVNHPLRPLISAQTLVLSVSSMA